MQCINTQVRIRTTQSSTGQRCFVCLQVSIEAEACIT
jgi:hypothetical protein